MNRGFATVVALLTASVLVGCGGGDESDSGAGEGAAAAGALARRISTP